MANANQSKKKLSMFDGVDAVRRVRPSMFDGTTAVKKAKPSMLRDTAILEKRRRQANAHEASAMRVANKVRRTADPERLRQFEEAFMKPRTGGGKRTKQQR